MSYRQKIVGNDVLYKKIKLELEHPIREQIQNTFPIDYFYSFNKGFNKLTDLFLGYHSDTVQNIKTAAKN